MLSIGEYHFYILFYINVNIIKKKEIPPSQMTFYLIKKMTHVISTREINVCRLILCHEKCMFIDVSVVSNIFSLFLLQNCSERVVFSEGFENKMTIPFSLNSLNHSLYRRYNNES